MNKYLIKLAAKMTPELKNYTRQVLETRRRHGVKMPKDDVLGHAAEKLLGLRGMKRARNVVARITRNDAKLK